MQNQFKADFKESWISKKGQQALDLLPKSQDLPGFAPSGAGGVYSAGKAAMSTIRDADAARRLDNVSQSTNNAFVKQHVANHPESKLDTDLSCYVASVLAEMKHPTLDFNDGKVSFGLDKPGVMETLLKHLSPAKNEAALAEGADPDAKIAEQSRLALRQKLGCPDDCDLGKNYKPGGADKVIKKLLSGADGRLNSATGGAMMNIKNHHNESLNNDAKVLQKDFMENGNQPNFLKIINIAAEWVKP